MNFIENLFHTRLWNEDTGINSTGQFHAILKSERFRSDRINKGFSLILFNFSNSLESQDAIIRFIGIMKSKIRNYDEMGWFDDNSIALLLPETSPDNARKVLNKIMSVTGHLSHIPNPKIITYPTQQLDFLRINSDNNEVDIHALIADGYLMPFWKRAFDIVFSLTILFLLSPLMLLTAVFIKMVSSGPVFFRQERVGQAGKIFNLLKFRTMVVNNDDSEHREYLKKLIRTEDGRELPMIKIENDKRIIMFGKIIRKICIDELPQFINVLMGDMSIVGPRPCIPYEAKEFLHWHKRRFDIVPGITGLWQVSGKNNTTFKEMIRYDIEYATNRSFWLDLKIIFKTPIVIIGQIFESINKRIEGKTRNLALDSTETSNI